MARSSAINFVREPFNPFDSPLFTYNICAVADLYTHLYVLYRFNVLIGRDDDNENVYHIIFFYANNVFYGWSFGEKNHRFPVLQRNEIVIVKIFLELFSFRFAGQMMRYCS